MNQIAYSLREGGLTLAYHTIVTLRDRLRRRFGPAAVGVRSIVTRGERMLMVRHRSGPAPWSLPGGGVGRGEDLAAAALREIREEGGCAAQIGHLLGMYYQRDGRFDNYIGVFVCATSDAARPPVADIEIVDARFFLPQDIPANSEAGSLRRIAEYRQGLAGLARPW